MPARNSVRTIERCLLSIRAQDYSPIEIIVVDNHSSDGTAGICEGLADRFIVAGPERSAQRNIGMRKSTGEFVLFVDSDMVLEPDVVSDSVRTQQTTEASAVAIPERSFGIGYWARCKALGRSAYEKDSVISAARFFRKTKLLEIGGYDEDLISGEDWDLSIRATGGCDLVFARALILHDEGRLSLTLTARKKFTYGLFLPAFLARQGPEALRRLNPLRSASLRTVKQLRTSPSLAAGMLVLRGVEISAFAFGFACGALRALFRRVIRTRRTRAGTEHECDA